MKKTAAVKLVLFFGAASLFWGGCRSQDNPTTRENIVPVETGEVVVREVSVPVHTSGRLLPKTQVKLSFKTGGIIDKIYVDEGDRVRKGQILASLDLAEVKARFNQARNGYLKAQRDLERAENLYGDRAATLEQLQNAGTAFKIAESNLSIARFNLKHSKIIAPAEGKILKRLVEKNEMIGVGFPVFLFGSTENRWVVKSGVSERDMVRLALHDTARVQFDAYPRKVFSARVSEISEAVDPATGTYEVESAVRDEGMRLAAGFIARVDIYPARKEKFTLVPVDALVEGEGDSGFVYTIKDRKARKTRIKISHLAGDRMAVKSGLEGIKEVITLGAAYVKDGSPVKVTNRDRRREK